MDHVHTLLMLIVPCSVLCGHIPAPESLTISSHHFVHLLRWQAGPGSPTGLRYRVIVRSNGIPWRTVDGCDAVLSPLLCNLTDFFPKLDEIYYINVTAVLGNKMSTPRSLPPFKPDSDTDLKLPTLQVSPCNDSLCVYLQSPSERLHTVYSKLQYTLNVTNERGEQFLASSRGLKTVDIKVVPGLQYCVSVNIKGRQFTPEPAVCASKPAALHNTDAVISAVLGLLGLIFGVAVGLLFLKTVIHLQTLKTRHPFVLKSFNPPYKVQLISSPTVESLKCIYLEPNTNEDAQVSEDVDPEKDMGYEGRTGCEETSEEHTQNPVTETYDRVPVNLLKEPMLAPEMAATPQNTSQILTTNHHLLTTPIQKLRKGDSTSLMLKREKELEQEKKEDGHREDSDDVNFFSLTLGGQNSEQQGETEEEESTESGKKVITKIPLFVLEPPELAIDIQPVCSEQTSKLISYSEEDEEEDPDEEEAFSGYMMRS